MNRAAEDGRALLEAAQQLHAERHGSHTFTPGTHLLLQAAVRRTLYPFINTHSGGATPRKGYTAEEVSRAYPEFCAEKLLGLHRNSRQRGRGHTRT
jgi:hypothetical protein